MRRFERKTIVVTGSGRDKGLGQAILQRIADEGANCVVSDLGKPAEHMGASDIGTTDEMEAVAAELKSRGVRVEVDTSDDRMAKKIVNHTNQKVPFMLLAGDRDVEAGALSFRFGDRTQINGVPRAQAVETIVKWIADRQNVAPTAELVKVDGG